MTICLTGIAMCIPMKLEYWLPIMLVCCVFIILGSIFAWIFSIGWLETVVAFFAVILFSIYIIIDTKLIMGRDIGLTKKTTFSIEKNCLNSFWARNRVLFWLGQWIESRNWWIYFRCYDFIYGHYAVIPLFIADFWKKLISKNEL